MHRLKLVIPAVLVVVGIITTGYFVLQPHYFLTTEQRAQLNTHVRLGTAGRDGFYMSIRYPVGETIEALTTPDNKRIIPTPIPLGKSFTSVSDDIINTDHYTPTVVDGAAYVTYNNEFGNLVASATEKVVLRNPDASLFGRDGKVSVDEMNAFFANSHTELVSFNHSEKDWLDGDCNVNLKLDGDLLLTNNFASACSRDIKSSSFEDLLTYLNDSL